MRFEEASRKNDALRGSFEERCASRKLRGTMRFEEASRNDALRGSFEERCASRKNDALRGTPALGLERLENVRHPIRLMTS